METIKNAILDALKEVIDPELLVNVVDLGLVYDIRIFEEKKQIEVDMSLTSTGCPLGDMIVSNAQMILFSKFPEYSSEVHLVWEPRWTAERMSPEGREALGRR